MSTEIESSLTQNNSPAIMLDNYKTITKTITIIRMNTYEYAYIAKHKRQILHRKGLQGRKILTVCLWILYNLYFHIKIFSEKIKNFLVQ